MGNVYILQLLILCERLEGKNHFLVQTICHSHQWWQFSMKFYFIGQLVGHRFLSLHISNFNIIYRLQLHSLFSIILMKSELTYSKH